MEALYCLKRGRVLFRQCPIASGQPHLKAPCTMEIDNCDFKPSLFQRRCVYRYVRYIHIACSTDRSPRIHSSWNEIAGALEIQGYLDTRAACLLVWRSTYMLESTQSMVSNRVPSFADQFYNPPPSPYDVQSLSYSLVHAEWLLFFSDIRQLKHSTFFTKPRPLPSSSY